jgi:histidine triad (HIT) family protein
MEDCVFCEIVAGRREATKVYEDESMLAFMDHYPFNPGHVLVIPKKHYPTLLEMPEVEVGELFRLVVRVAQAAMKAVGGDGVNIVQSNGRAASQEVFHVHVHVVPRFREEGGVWPSRKRMSREELNRIGAKIRPLLSPR